MGRAERGKRERLFKAAALTLFTAGAVMTVPFVVWDDFGTRLANKLSAPARIPYLDVPISEVFDGSQITTAFYSFELRLIEGCGGRRGGAVVADKGVALCFTVDGDLFELPLLQPVPLALPAGFASGGRLARELGLRHAALRVEDSGLASLSISYFGRDADEDCYRPTIAEVTWTTGSWAFGPWQESTPHPTCFDSGPSSGLSDSSGALSYGPDGTLWIVYGAFGQDSPEQDRQSRIFRRGAGATEWEETGGGLRNPMGIAAARDGTAYIVDNGPRGGDELNRVSGKMDFGWPQASLGTDYGSMDRASQPSLGRHGSGEPPVFAWVPSISPSDITFAPAQALPHWQGDLLVSALRGGGLYRIRLEGERVLYVEEIPLGARIRDIAMSETGEIFAMQDSGQGTFWLRPLAAEGDVAPVPLAICAPCHAAKTGTASAPPLDGIRNRDIASIETYAYSDALRNIAGQWSEQNLRAYLRNPQAFASGTTKTPLNLSPDELNRTIEALRK